MLGLSDATLGSLALLRKLEWKVRHRAEGLISGEYRSTFRGRGMEFDQVVPYEFGDDVRDIDWNVTARLGHPYRKKFVEEREVTILLFIEDTPTLAFGSGGRTKREAMMELASLVMLLGAANRDRVAVFQVNPDGFQFHRPVRGRGEILKLASVVLASTPPKILDDRPVEIPWKHLALAAPRHSIMVWLGDFAPRSVPTGWTQVRRRYQPMGFQVSDPWELKLPQDEEMNVLDPVSGEILPFSPSSFASQEAHAQWRAAREESLARLFPDVRTRLTVSTEEDLLGALVGFMRRRMGAVR